MVEGKSKEEIEDTSLKDGIFNPRGFTSTWKLYNRIKDDINWVR
jgi:hypothetical protein